MATDFFERNKPPADYRIPDNGEDHDIKASKKNLESAEKKSGHTLFGSLAQKEPEEGLFVQTRAGSDPIGASIGIVQYLHP